MKQSDFFSKGGKLPKKSILSFLSCKLHAKITAPAFRKTPEEHKADRLTDFLLLSPERIATELAHGIYCFIFFLVLSVYTPNWKLEIDLESEGKLFILLREKEACTCREGKQASRQCAAVMNENSSTSLSSCKGFSREGKSTFGHCVANTFFFQTHMPHSFHSFLALD